MNSNQVFKEIYENLQSKRANWIMESEVRQDWISELSKSLNLSFHIERERNDASYNQVIIEFKNKGFFLGNIESAPFKNAINDRLRKYIERKSKNEGLPIEDYIGIAIDGDHICFAHFRNGKIKHGTLMPFNSASVSMVAQACTNSKHRAVTANNLIEDFGHGSIVGRELMQSMASFIEESLNSGTTNKAKMLYQEWKTLFGQVAGLSKLQKNSIEKSIGFTINVDENEHISALLFVIHTYNSLLIKLIGAEIVAEHELTSFRDFSQYASTLEGGELIEFINEQIENSQVFETAGIKGFVEEVIFSWYIDSYNRSVNKTGFIESLKNLLVLLSLYRTDTLDSVRSTDVLKKLYQGLVPDALRKSLGEFYTPDWLVEYVLKHAIGKKNWLKTRSLDPTCGSGSFLLQLVKLYRDAAKRQKWTTKKTLLYICDNIWGFDLNPLAVQTARVNFLISVSDLLEENKGMQIEIPVLLADAVYSPARNPQDDEEVVEYRIGSAEADLLITIPYELAFDRKKLDQIFDIMGNMVEEEIEYKGVEKKLVRLNLMDNKQANNWEESLKSTYEKVLALHKKNWNGIWFRIVRNFFWSATAGKFDLIVGNPPWVRWSNLPVGYRERIKPTCMQYSIFSETPHHGGNELDISGMITYTVSDKWLKDNGTLAFLITQTHFQSPSSAGFRRFNINNVFNLIPTRVEDLKALKPFPDAANKTALGIFQKTKKRVNYPVAYNEWHAANGFTRAIPLEASLKEVENRIQRINKEATPVDQSHSPWAIMLPGEFSKVSKIKGASKWVNGRKGITCDLNGIYFVEILEVNEDNGIVQIETRPEAGKTDLGPKRKFWIEAKTLYPLIKGASDFSSYSFHPKNNLYTILPNRNINKQGYADAERFIEYDNPKTFKYLKAYKKLLADRSTYRGRMPLAPYYAVYNVGDYTFSPYKVIWAEQSGNFCSAVITNKEVPLVGNRPYVPDHKIFFVEFSKGEPAFYLCALLNSRLVRQYVSSHTISIQVGNIFKHLNLPQFDATNLDHIKISKLSKKAHNQKDIKKRTKLVSEIDDLCEKILSV